MTVGKTVERNNRNSSNNKLVHDLSGEVRICLLRNTRDNDIHAEYNCKPTGNVIQRNVQMNTRTYFIWLVTANFSYYEFNSFSKTLISFKSRKTSKVLCLPSHWSFSWLDFIHQCSMSKKKRFIRLETYIESTTSDLEGCIPVPAPSSRDILRFTSLTWTCILYRIKNSFIFGPLNYLETQLACRNNLECLVTDKFRKKVSDTQNWELINYSNQHK